MNMLGFGSPHKTNQRAWLQIETEYYYGTFEDIFSIIFKAFLDFLWEIGFLFLMLLINMMHVLTTHMHYVTNLCIENIKYLLEIENGIESSKQVMGIDTSDIENIPKCWGAKHLSKNLFRPLEFPWGWTNSKPQPKAMIRHRSCSIL